MQRLDGFLRGIHPVSLAPEGNRSTRRDVSGIEMMSMVADETAGESQAETRYERDRYLTMLFDQNFVALRKLAFALVGEAGAAEDIAQDAFVRLYASLRRLDRLDHAPSFLRRIVINECRSRARRAAVRERLDPMLGQPASVDEPDVARRLDIWSALSSLPSRQRMCVVLRYLEDLSDSDIADLLGCSIGTVKSQLHKARHKLGPLLSEEGWR